MTSYLKTTVYPYLINKIEIYCTPFYDREELHGILKYYQKLHGATGIIDLGAYIIFAEKSNIDFNRLRETLLHDVEHRADELFLPQTRGFADTLTKLELEKNFK